MDLIELLNRTEQRERGCLLIEKGLVVEIGAGPKDPRRRYFLAEAKP